MKTKESDAPQVEKLNLWDRLFNRTRKTIIERGSENWVKYYSNFDLYPGEKIPNSGYSRNYVIYKIIDRVTGSESLKKEYLN